MEGWLTVASPARERFSRSTGENRGQAKQNETGSPTDAESHWVALAEELVRASSASRPLSRIAAPIRGEKSEKEQATFTEALQEEEQKDGMDSVTNVHEYALTPPIEASEAATNQSQPASCGNITALDRVEKQAQQAANKNEVAVAAFANGVGMHVISETIRPGAYTEAHIPETVAAGGAATAEATGHSPFPWAAIDQRGVHITEESLLQRAATTNGALLLGANEATQLSMLLARSTNGKPAGDAATSAKVLPSELIPTRLQLLSVGGGITIQFDALEVDPNSGHVNRCRREFEVNPTTSDSASRDQAVLSTRQAAVVPLERASSQLSWLTKDDSLLRSLGFDIEGRVEHVEWRDQRLGSRSNSTGGGGSSTGEPRGKKKRDKKAKRRCSAIVSFRGEQRECGKKLKHGCCAACDARKRQREKPRKENSIRSEGVDDVDVDASSRSNSTAPSLAVPQVTAPAQPSKKEEKAGQETEESGEPFCTCRKPSKGVMIACDNENCALGWFHASCLGFKHVPTGKWYCGECQRDQTAENAETGPQGAERAPGQLEDTALHSETPTTTGKRGPGRPKKRTASTALGSERPDAVKAPRKAGKALHKADRSAAPATVARPTATKIVKASNAAEKPSQRTAAATRGGEGARTGQPTRNSAQSIQAQLATDNEALSAAICYLGCERSGWPALARYLGWTETKVKELIQTRTAQAGDRPTRTRRG